MYQSRKQATQDAAKMQGWEDIQIVKEQEPGIDGLPTIYIVARDPVSKRIAIFDSPQQEQARFV